MRIITYNILNGGEGRADPLAEVLEAQRPDVVALIEADVTTVTERIATRLAMDFIIAPGQGHSVALLSRYPIQLSINHAILNQNLLRSFLEATVLTPDGTEWPIGVLHLSAGASDAEEDAREREIEIVLNLFSEHRKAGRPHLLCGDFNSTAPYQVIDSDRCKLKTQHAWKSNGDRLPRRVVQSLLDAGYLDTYHTLHDEGTKMIGSFDTQTAGQRVDYIFAFGVPVADVKNAWVEQDRLAKYASDHFPVGAEIDGNP